MVLPTQAEGNFTVPVDVEPKRPSQKLPPGEWVKQNLFGGVGSSIVTIVLGVLLILLVRWLLNWAINAEWEIVRANLRNFMIGGFPRDELWRVWAFSYLLIAGSALGFGALARFNHDQAISKELPSEKEDTVALARRFGPALALVLLFVSNARTSLVFIGVAVGIVGFFVLREIGWHLPLAFRSRALFIFAYFVIVAFAVIAGTSGLLGAIAGIVTAVLVSSELGKAGIINRVAGIAAPVLGGLVVWFVIRSIGFEGFGWDDWGGFLITIFATVVGITAGLPLGIMLALGRKSKLPVIRTASVLFIEFVRGVPLISLLLFSSFMLPLFFPLGTDTRSGLTRAMILITGFSAAYFAEIVRGGLQAVPKGQTEAAQASGMSPGSIQRLIVLPQALRSVIPAMVGQAIALFKDTTLLSIIGIGEFLQFATIANTQPDFLGKGLQPVTYTFVALGYWAISYTMSRESRRIETKLGVGVR